MSEAKTKDQLMFNPDSAEWRQIMASLESRITSLQKELEAYDTPFDRTQFLRGRIHELRDLLALK